MAQQLAPDWILQQALAAQSIAHREFVRGRPELRTQDGSLTMAVVGCGVMGRAILGGVMAALPPGRERECQQKCGPTRRPNKFHACVRTCEGAERVKAELGRYGAELVVWENDNLGAVRQSEVVLLACEPHVVGHVLRQEGMGDALAGKLLISICAGVPEEYLLDLLVRSQAPDGNRPPCFIVRALPNMAAAVRESMTVVTTPEAPLLALSEEHRCLVMWIFRQVGTVSQLKNSHLRAAAALCGSSPAFYAVVAESMAAGAMAAGLPRSEAYAMAAQAMRGTAALLVQGEHPATLRDKISTPGGCTTAGLQVLEDGCLRGTVSKAVREAASAAKVLADDRT